MSSEQWTIAGKISFRAKQKGIKGDLEHDAEAMMMDICLYAANKYPGYTFDGHPISIYQKLSERFKI